MTENTTHNTSQSPIEAMQSDKGASSKTNHLPRRSALHLSKDRTGTDNYVLDGMDVHRTAGDPFAKRLGIDDHKDGASKMFVAPTLSSGRLRFARIFGSFLRGLSKFKASCHIK